MFQLCVAAISDTTRSSLLPRAVVQKNTHGAGSSGLECTKKYTRTVQLPLRRRGNPNTDLYFVPQKCDKISRTQKQTFASTSHLAEYKKRHDTEHVYYNKKPAQTSSTFSDSKAPTLLCMIYYRPRSSQKCGQRKQSSTRAALLHT